MSNGTSSRRNRATLRWLLPALLTVGFAVVLLIVLVPREQRRLYIEGIEEQRRQTERFLRLSPDSPILAAEKRVFTGLEYFPVDPRFRVEATLERIDETPVFALPTTGDTEDLYERYAWAEFELLDLQYRLLVLRSPNAQSSNQLFLAFNDETNGDTTYRGGRYIDLYFDTPETVTIDFNRAYNPYCVYDPTYVCPLPPIENDLPVGIEAGERMYIPKSGS